MSAPPQLYRRHPNAKEGLVRVGGDWYTSFNASLDSEMVVLW